MRSEEILEFFIAQGKAEKVPFFNGTRYYTKWSDEDAYVIYLSAVIEELRDKITVD
ncbi:hypothetical protein [Saccharospirillum salsuginis]|uniref:Uncharacterized protein n=1 Tax=Saccharospirillum salsuginis TaxID=418750 RepID=A0A918K670_9GAMM|nr:hypothetical protein [Saccharospirillum salsuginis]GGX51475.1 hypothetical protein GCM10007392_18460 [Saccharospirillum salsuginis]